LFLSRSSSIVKHRLGFALNENSFPTKSAQFMVRDGKQHGFKHLLHRFGRFKRDFQGLLTGLPGFFEMQPGKRGIWWVVVWGRSLPHFPILQPVYFLGLFCTDRQPICECVHALSIIGTVQICSPAMSEFDLLNSRWRYRLNAE
jgi:hypothetical protein